MTTIDFCMLQKSNKIFELYIHIIMQKKLQNMWHNKGPEFCYTEISVQN